MTYQTDPATGRYEASHTEQAHAEVLHSEALHSETLHADRGGMEPGAGQVRADMTIEPDAVEPLLGPADRNLAALERQLGADIHVRGTDVTLTGSTSEVALAEQAVDELARLAESGGQLTPDVVERTVGMLAGEAPESPAEVLSLDILSTRGKTIRPKTLGQKQYVDAIEANTIVFGIGPAGTGKTYLAMAKAVSALQSKDVSRIILTRPAVEAGERLGYLPGSLDEKIDPYVRPLYDALHDMMDPEAIPRLMQAGIIEVAPLAYMRGRTLNDAFVILDEAQNTTGEQMKMFLTRLGFGSKVVVTGDVTQVDLPGGARSGLRAARHILTGIDDIRFVELSSRDVVRHRLVTDIVDAYERFENGPPHASANDSADVSGGRRGGSGGGPDSEPDPGSGNRVQRRSNRTRAKGHRSQ